MKVLGRSSLGEDGDGGDGGGEGDSHGDEREVSDDDDNRGGDNGFTLFIFNFVGVFQSLVNWC